ncbi:NADH-quinone oxidoreductase subunit L [Rhodanobacter aciditrophus]|uniref:Probable inorganic carbon transporter subunit DabB n=1 Tax=Rhodanobacter aciditrophus TaxID=1623218 RepID=A0ABW4AZX7_9GAMM
MTFFTFLLPILFALTGIACGLQRWQKHAAKIALWGSRIAPVILLISLISWMFQAPSRLALALDAPVNGTMLSALMLILVVFMAWILVQFSQHYMAGSQRVSHYYRWLMLTLSAVTLTLTSNHLLAFWAGWMGISLGLHFLLTYYPDRHRAIIAAHKKFILARVAEISLLVAFWLLSQAHDSWYITNIMAQMDEPLTWQEQVASILIAVAALMKCAQLPVHGWLMQVVEAPTPVSALLHAGIINLGGYLVLTFYPLLHLSGLAIWLLLIVAGLTTLVSALIMTTRISVKVRLAWSTSAQMGLMLLECALGLYELAILHLLTHSVYKAHAFLNSGSAVQEFLQRKLAPDESPNYLSWIAAAAFSVVSVTLAIWFWGYHGPMSPWWLFAFALTILVAQGRSVPRPAHLVRLGAVSLGLALLYGGLKTVMGWLLQNSLEGHATTHTVAAYSAPDLWACALFIALVALAICLRYYAHLPWVRQFSTALFAGFYLDEWFTKVTLQIWPVRLPAHSKVKHQSNKFGLTKLPKKWKK